MQKENSKKQFCTNAMKKIVITSGHYILTDNKVFTLYERQAATKDGIEIEKVKIVGNYYSAESVSHKLYDLGIIDKIDAVMMISEITNRFIE